MSLKLKVALANFLGVLLLSGALFFTGSIILNVVEQRSTQSTFNRNEVVWKQIVDAQGISMLTGTQNITRNRALLKNIKNGNSKDEDLVYVYNRLEAEGTINFISMYDFKGDLLLSQPSVFDLSTKNIIDNVLKDKKSQMGFVQNSKGKIYLAYAFPVFYRAKPVAVGVFFKELIDKDKSKGMLVELKNYLVAEASVIGGKENEVVYATVDEGLIEDLKMPNLGVMQLDFKDFKENIYESVVTPLRDYNGKAVAHLVTQRDVTVNLKKERLLEVEAGALALVGMIIIAIGSFIFSGYLFAPLTSFAKKTDTMSAEELFAVEVDTSRKDEIGVIANAVAQSMKTFKDDAEQTQLEIELNRRNAEKDKKRIVTQMANNFEEKVGSVIEALSMLAFSVKDNAVHMVEDAKQSTEKAVIVASVAEESSANVNAMASSTNQLSSSINEINIQVMNSSRITKEAKEKAEKTSKSVQQLVGLSENIDQVISLISDIAARTNLLALNATIEAARAGDAGKGFAVVASEVKSLATQTSKATEDISVQIIAIQEATRESDESIQEIIGVINDVNEISQSVAAAVNEQEISTEEILINIRDTSDGTKIVAENIMEVKDASTQTGESAANVLESSEDLVEQSNILKASIKDFLESMRNSI